jgi:60 kDa SS-A/Ro ribonucleoprotein
MRHYEEVHGTLKTPQGEAIPGRESEMAQNSAGGFSFVVDDWKRLERFLVLGTEGGSYYAGERELSKDNAEVVGRCTALDGRRAVELIASISESGRAPKNDEALYALAMCAGAQDVATRQAALAALPRVARTGTHLFQFVTYVKAFRGWGRSLRDAVAAWYLTKNPEDLALQLIKYRQREGWTHKDVLAKAMGRKDIQDRLVAAGEDAVMAARLRNMLWSYRCAEAPADGSLDSKQVFTRDDSGFIWAFEEAQKAKGDPKACARLVTEFRLPWEALPTEVTKDLDVQAALLPHMGLGAMVRQFGRMSAIGFLKPLSDASKLVCAKLADEAQIRKSRLHPMAILLAMKMYQQGHGDKGGLSWQPVSAVVDALDAAFYSAFGNVKSTGKRRLLALDVSGSMSPARCAGTLLSCREASAALAMVTAKVEPDCVIIGFTATADGRVGGRHGGGEPGITLLDISPRRRIDDVVNYTAGLKMGGTDCSLPMVWAMREKLAVDSFETYTDGETWHGPIHPTQALRKYRETSGRAAKAAVVALTPTKFSIADPTDAGQMDFVGLDAALPAVLADFVRG